MGKIAIYIHIVMVVILLFVCLPGLTACGNNDSASSTAITLTSSKNPSIEGEEVTFLATVDASDDIPTGTITFKDGDDIMTTVFLSSGQASYTTSALPVGTHNVTAFYKGNDNFAASTSDSLTQTVNLTPAWKAMSSDTTNSFQSVWGSSADNVFAVGESGIILHYDGNSWSEMESNTTEWLRSVWGNSANNVFAVGQSGTILHYDGIAWNEMESNTTDWLVSIWGSSANDVFTVGKSGVILHYNDNSWSAMNSGTTNWIWSVWGSSASDIYAMGESSTILHYDGNTWSAMNSGTKNWLVSVWGSSASDIFAVGNSGIILHYNPNL